MSSTLACLLVASVFTLSVGTNIVLAEDKTIVQETERIYGNDRYETGAKIVAEGWKEPTEYAVLAAGMNENLVDSLAAAPLAKLYNAPILLTEGKRLTPATKEELKRLETKTVFLTTGKGVIQEEVIKELTELGIELVYLGGKDRFETSVNIALEIAKEKPIKELVLTTAWGNADALSIAPIAAIKGMPILLTNSESLPSTVQSYINNVQSQIERTYILGGEKLVSTSIESSLPSAKRLSGNDRFETNLIVIQEFAEEFQVSNVFIANGADNHLVDALAVSPLAALLGAPVILTGPNMSDDTREYITSLDSAKLTFLGSNKVIPDSVVDMFRNTTQDTPVVPPTGGGAPGGSIVNLELKDFKVLTNPVNSVPGADNGGTIDLSQLDDNTMITGISITANQESTLGLTKVTNLAGTALDLRRNPPPVDLVPGSPTIIQVSDIVDNLLERPEGVSIGEFRFVFGRGAIFHGEVTQNGEVKATVKITILFKS